MAKYTIIFSNFDEKEVTATEYGFDADFVNFYDANGAVFSASKKSVTTIERTSN